jgi:hypothetical protein
MRCTRSQVNKGAATRYPARNVTKHIMPESKRRKPKNRTATPPSSPAVAEHKREPSPTWYVVLMAGLMVVGVLLVLARFIFSLDQLILIAGLALIAAGFMMTTNYH